MLLDSLQSDLNTSLKGGKADRVETLRFLIAGVRNSAIAKYGNEWETKLQDTDVLDVVKKQIKTHNESIEAFTKAGRQDLVNREKMQRDILSEFAPKEMSDEDLKKILEPIAASGESNFGLLMKSAMTAVAGKAEGGRVSKLLQGLIKK